MSRHDSVSLNYRGFLTGARTGEDGLTYKETVFRAAAPSGLFHHRPAVPWYLAIADPRADGLGAHTLDFLARRVLNTHIAHLHASVLAATPWDPFGHQLWNDALATRADSFPVWCAFATAYGGARIPGRKYTLPASERLPPLIAALNGAGGGGDWLVKLRLQDYAGGGGTDLGVLPALRNLRALYITGSSSSSSTGAVDDGMVRAWSRAATHGDAWHRLEVLSLRGFTRVTEISVREYCTAFPKLTWLDLSRCHWSVQNTAGSCWVQVGWEMWKELRGRRKKAATAADGPPLLKVVLGEYRKPSGRGQEMRFMRVEEEEEEAKRKPLPPTTTKIMAPVVRKKRLKDMGDLLAEFQNPPPKRRR